MCVVDARGVTSPPPCFDEYYGDAMTTINHPKHYCRLEPGHKRVIPSGHWTPSSHKCQCGHIWNAKTEDYLP
jgi:hypothetical protein